MRSGVAALADIAAPEAFWQLCRDELSGGDVATDGWDIRARCYGVVISAMPRPSVLGRGITIPRRVIAAQITAAPTPVCVTPQAALRDTHTVTKCWTAVVCVMASLPDSVGVDEFRTTRSGETDNPQNRHIVFLGLHAKFCPHLKLGEQLIRIVPRTQRRHTRFLVSLLARHRCQGPANAGELPDVATDATPKDNAAKLGGGPTSFHISTGVWGELCG
jgi:hypothetical protein